MPPKLSRDGLRLRTALAESGFEITPDQLASGIDDAIVRVRRGVCVSCRQIDELRFGRCFDCVHG